MNKTTTTVEDLLGDFCLPPGDGSKEIKSEARPVTIWLPSDAKAKYDKLQKKSGRRFSKKARELLIELISLAEKRIA